MDTNENSPAPVVVGVDGSTASDRALRWAAAEAAAWGARLRVTNAWSMPLSDWPYAGGPAYLEADEFRQRSAQLVQQAGEAVELQLGAGTVEVEGLTPEGQPAHELLEAARGARALVVGMRGRGGFADLVLGSVAAACIHHATAPVVLIGDRHEHLPGSGPIVVGIDGSDGARAALRWAADEAVRLGVRLVVVHGWDVPDVAPPGPVAFGPTESEDFATTADRFLAEFVEEALAADDGSDQRPEIETRAVSEPAVEALVHQADDAALLVVGTRGRGGFTGLLLGSVSRQCAHHAPCPVAIVPV